MGSTPSLVLSAAQCQHIMTALSSNNNSIPNSYNNINTATANNSNNIVRVGVGVIVYNTSKQIYVGRRKNSHGHNTIALPGGHLEFNETWEQCAHREVFEEMDVQLDLETIKFIHVSNNRMISESKHYITIIMIVTQPITVEPTNMEPHKCEGWVPYTLQELQQLSQTNPNEIFLPLLQLLQEYSYIIIATIPIVIIILLQKNFVYCYHLQVLKKEAHYFEVTKPKASFFVY